MKFSNGPFVQPVAAIKPSEGAPGQLQSSFVDLIVLAVQAQQLATDFGIARHQFKRALQLPDRFRECPLFIVDDTQAHPGDQAFGISTKSSLEELDRLPVHLLFQASFPQ